MEIPLRRFMHITGTEPVWVRYSYAAMMCALAIALDVLLDRVVSDRIYPFFPAVAAIIASAAWAGAGPGLAATTAMVIWSAFYLSRHGSLPPNVMVRGVLLFVEGAVAERREFANVERDAQSGAQRGLAQTTSGDRGGRHMGP